MYLDKPLKEHRLLQAIARTNRPYKDLKECDLVIDYVGILSDLTKAFEMYSESDWKGVLYSPDELRKMFYSLLESTLKIVGSRPSSVDLNVLREAFERITLDSKNEKEFIESYRQLKKLFELLDVGKVELERLEDFKWLTAVYAYYLSKAREEIRRHVNEYFPKVLKYVHESTIIKEIEKISSTLVFDENYLDRIEDKVKDLKERVADMVFVLNKFVLIEKGGGPIYGSLVDVVQHIIEEWRSRIKDYEKIYKDATGAFKEIRRLTERQKSLGLSNLEYALLLTIERWIGEGKEAYECSKELYEAIKGDISYPGWFLQTPIRKRVEPKVRIFARRLLMRKGLGIAGLDKFYNELLRGILSYGA